SRKGEPHERCRSPVRPATIPAKRATPPFDRSYSRFAMAFMIVAAIVASLPCRATAGEKPGSGERRPNIILIVAHDLGINDLSCYGRKDQPTPNLAGLAREGLRFTNAYAAAPVCSPTRAALMTGKTPARLHLTTFLPGRPDAPSQLLLHPVIE